MHVRPPSTDLWHLRLPFWRGPLRQQWLPPPQPRQIAFYAWQCTLATLSLLGIALTLNAWLHTTVVAALGASTFIVFATPHAPSAHSRALVGGYVIGVLAGTFCDELAGMAIAAGWPNIALLNAVSGALAVGLCAFFMLLTHTAHPPAAGVALYLAISPWDWRTVLFVIAATTLLATLRHLLDHRLHDLV